MKIFRSGTQPLLVTAFDRPELLELALQRIASLEDERRVYISVDGPPIDSTDQELSARIVATHALAESFRSRYPHWRLRLSPSNLGCQQGVVSAITWAFENEDALIVLEDDIVPTRDFFRFCDQGLEHFADDLSVGSLSGHSSVPLSQLGAPREPLRMSNFSSSWGWATWRNRWLSFDVRATELKRPKQPQQLQSQSSMLFWRTIGALVARGHIDSWAYPWLFQHWQEGWFSVTPRQTLTTNAGFGPGSTHTRKLPPGAHAATTSELRDFEESFIFTRDLKLDLPADQWLNTVGHRATLKNAVAVAVKAILHG